MRKERSLDILRALLLLSILEGIPTIIFLFRIPSDVDNSTLFGFAPQRVGLGALFVFLLILMIYYFMRSILDDPWFKRIGERIDNALSRGNRLLVSVTTLSFVVFSGILGMILFSTPILQLFGPIQHIYVRSISLIIWFILVSSQALIILLWVYHPIWQSPRYFFKVETFQILLLLTVFSATLFHWTILILKDAVLASFPYWWGNFRPQPFSIRDFLVLISIALVLIAIRIITVSSQGAIRKLGFLIFLGFIIQVSFGFIKGGGFRSLEAALTNSIQDRFAVEAAQGLDFLEMTRQYEEHHGQRFLPATKPPGALALYILFEKIANQGDDENISQFLLEPIVVTLPATEIERLEKLLDLLTEIGFQLEPFGPGAYKITAVPLVLSSMDPKEALMSAISDDQNSPKELVDTVNREKMITRICKRLAIKGGQALSTQEQKQLIRDLENCKNPRTCPHGRPTMIHISVDVLERQFGRRGSV